MMKDHTAPWSTLLIVISSLSTVLCVGIAGVMFGSGSGPIPWLALLPLGIVVGGVMFMIRGYVITAEALLVRRLGWTTRVPLDGLRSVRFEPDAMRWSIRTCGNGGLFSFTGWYRNKTLGAYRAFVTDPRRAVVLRFEKRTVVVSPGSPEAFVGELEGRCGP